MAEGHSGNAGGGGKGDRWIVTCTNSTRKAHIVVRTEDGWRWDVYVDTEGVSVDRTGTNYVMVPWAKLMGHLELPEVRGS